MNNNMMPPQFRFAATIVIWIIVAIALLTMLTASADFNWIFGIVMLGIAGGVTSSIMGADGGKNWTSSSKAEETISKAKRGDNLSEMLSMLDEEDVYEIRQRIKQRLLDRVDSGSNEDIESFEQLLSARDRQKRK